VDDDDDDDSDDELSDEVRLGFFKISTCFVMALTRSRHFNCLLHTRISKESSEMGLLPSFLIRVPMSGSPLTYIKKTTLHLQDELDVGDPNVLPPAEDMEPDGPPQMATYDGGEEGEGWEEYDENSDTLEAEEDFQRQRAGSRSRTKSVYKSDSEDDEEDPDAPEPYLVDGAGEGGEGSGNGNRGRTNSGSSAGRGGGGRSSTGRPGYGTGHGVVSANMQRIDMMKV
jgi:uncharacterized membrane protein YgcG